MESNQENQRTEMFDIDSLLKEANIRQEEKQPEEPKAEDVLEKLTGEKKEEEAPEEVKKPIESLQQSKPTQFSEKLQDYIATGFLEDVQITIGEGSDTQEVFLSELKDLDEDTFNTVISEYKKAKDKDLSENYISKEGLDDRTKKYIELKKAGGDLNQLIEHEIQYVNPLSQFDLEDEVHQEELVRRSLLAQGYKPKYVEQEIAEMKENVSLDLEAKKIADAINKKFDETVEAKKKEQLEKIEAEKVEQKEFRKNISTALKELVPNENISKVLLDNSTKRDEYGLTNTDKLYFDAQKDTQKFAKIAFFLNNEEEFYKNIGAKVKTDAAKKTIKTFFSINPSIVKTTIKETKSDTIGDKVFESLTEKFQTK
jgi:hypothetical protein